MGFLVFGVRWFSGPGTSGKKVEGAWGFEEGVGGMCKSGKGIGP
jgi:hypothetical protein